METPRRLVILEKTWPQWEAKSEFIAAALPPQQAQQLAKKRRPITCLALLQLAALLRADRWSLGADSGREAAAARWLPP